VEKLDAAELALAAASASATNATEVTHATIAVNQLSNQLSQVMAGVLLVREAGVDSLKSLLDNLDDELRHATTNIDLFSTNTPAYQNALADLRYAEEQSLSLRERLDGERKDAPVPLALTAEIVSRAEPPRRPASPNRILTAGLLSGGTLAGILGVLLLCIPDRRPPKQAGPIQLSPGRRLS
jgi:uncharacterized protein involved in exopolysaccharide biosynthesis